MPLFLETKFDEIPNLNSQSKNLIGFEIRAGNKSLQQIRIKN